jgi:hypothetical protein
VKKHSRRNADEVEEAASGMKSAKLQTRGRLSARLVTEEPRGS